MKYAFLFSTIFLCLLSSLHARTITSFQDSEALMTIAQFMIDNAEDMPTSPRISDKKLKVKDPSACVSVSTAAVIKEVESAIKSVLRLYPDEELPMEEAMNDLVSYIGSAPLKKCIVTQSNNQKLVEVSYFYNLENTVHIKVDRITLLIQ